MEVRVRKNKSFKSKIRLTNLKMIEYIISMIEFDFGIPDECTWNKLIATKFIYLRFMKILLLNYSEDFY